MNHRHSKRRVVSKRFAAFLLALLLTAAFPAAVPQTAYAATKAEIDTLAAHIPDNWPQAPELASEAAILVEINSGTIVYAKNATRSMYPASTTKLMTAYLTLKNCALDDVVTYSKTAVLSLEPGSSHIGLRVGESLTVEDSLYGLLLPSANEVANGLAEKVSGTIASFASLMNETASELGCVNTNFCNANGLHDPNHMTCAYDLYLILQACLKQSDFLRIASSRTYVRPADELLNKEIPMATTNQFLKKDSEYYDSTVICGKTGWTEQAGRCLVTYAERGDLDLICVVMNSEAPNQYLDTRLLLNYAEKNFTSVRPCDKDDGLNPNKLRSTSPLGLSDDVISLMEPDTSSRVLLPNTVSFDELTRSTAVSEDGSRIVTYKLEGYPLGSASIVQEAIDDSTGLWNTASDSLLSSITVTSLHTVNIWLLLVSAAVIILLTAVIILILRILAAPKEPPTKGEDEHRMLFQ